MGPFDRCAPGLVWYRQPRRPGPLCRRRGRRKRHECCACRCRFGRRRPRAISSCRIVSRDTAVPNPHRSPDLIVTKKGTFRLCGNGSSLLCGNIDIRCNRFHSRQSLDPLGSEVHANGSLPASPPWRSRMPWVPILPPPGMPRGPPLPSDGSISTDRARPDPVAKVPPERVRESCCYSLTLPPAPDATRVAVEETCRWRGEHVHGPALAAFPSVIAIEGRDGSVRTAAREYATSGTPPAAGTGAASAPGPRVRRRPRPPSGAPASNPRTPRVSGIGRPAPPTPGGGGDLDADAVADRMGHPQGRALHLGSGVRRPAAGRVGRNSALSRRPGGRRPGAPGARTGTQVGFARGDAP